MGIYRRVMCSMAGAVIALLSLTAPSLANSHREVFGDGDVRLGACDGATAQYIMITPAEDKDLLGLGGNDMAASLSNLGTGQSGATFFPDYSTLTVEQKAAVQFGNASVLFKGNVDATKHANVSVCFGDGTSKTIALSDLKPTDSRLGWKIARLGPRSFGIKDDDARRLDRISVTLSGEGSILVGNVETAWEINRRDGRQLFFGWNLFSRLDTKLEDCSILNSCK